MSVYFPFRQIRRKVSRAKGNPSLQILEYSTPRPTLKTLIWISNFFGTKLSRWHLGITSFWHQLGSSLGLEIPRYYSRGFLFAFPVGVYCAYPFLGGLNEWWNGEMVKQIFPRWGFTMHLLYWGTTSLHAHFLTLSFHIGFFSSSKSL